MRRLALCVALVVSLTQVAEGEVIPGSSGHIRASIPNIDESRYWPSGTKWVIEELRLVDTEATPPEVTKALARILVTPTLLSAEARAQGGGYAFVQADHTETVALEFSNSDLDPTTEVWLYVRLGAFGSYGASGTDVASYSRHISGPVDTRL